MIPRIVELLDIQGRDGQGTNDRSTSPNSCIESRSERLKTNLLSKSDLLSIDSGILSSVCSGALSVIHSGFLSVTYSRI